MYQTFSDINTLSAISTVSANAERRVCEEVLFPTNQSAVDTPKKIIDAVSDIMDEGATEFEKRMGRPMTYAEMRAMYG